MPNHHNKKQCKFIGNTNDDTNVDPKQHLINEMCSANISFAGIGNSKASKLERMGKGIWDDVHEGRRYGRGQNGVGLDLARKCLICDNL